MLIHCSKKSIPLIVHFVLIETLLLIRPTYGSQIAEHTARSPPKEDECSSTGTSTAAIYSHHTATHSPDLLPLDGCDRQQQNDVKQQQHLHATSQHVTTDDSQRLTRSSTDWEPLTPPQ